MVCPACEFVHTANGETKFFDYRPVRRKEGTVIEDGEFIILHVDYIRETQRLKYCLVCYSTNIGRDSPVVRVNADSVRLSTMESRTSLV